MSLIVIRVFPDVVLVTTITQVVSALYRECMARKSSNLLAPIIVVFLIVGGCTQLVNKMFGTDEESVKAARIAALGPLPNLVGKTLVDAENEVEARGLELSQAGIGGDSYCDIKVECLVYRVEPKAGVVVQPGGEVAVRFITIGERAFYERHRKMPNVVGWSEDKTDRFFKPIREVLDTDEKESRRVPVDAYQVIAQSPKPGRPLRVGQEIKLVIGHNYGLPASTGNGDFNVNVPNWNGSRGGFCRSKWC